MVPRPHPAKVRHAHEQWEAQNHRKLEDGLYRGTLRRGTHHAGCGCAMGENGEEVHTIRLDIDIFDP